MIMSYTNSAGVTVPLSSAPYWILDTSTIFDYKLKHDDRFNRVYRVSKQIEEKQMDVAVKCSDNATFKSAIKALFNCFSYDTETNQPGALTVGDYSLKCFVFASKKNGQYNNKTSTIINFEIVPYQNEGWVKKKVYYFADERPLDHPYDHEYDMTALIGDYVDNDSFIDCDFVLEIIGKDGNQYRNPSVTIGNNVYKVNVYLNDGSSYIVINSLDKTIRAKISESAPEENVFNYRDRENYIFQKISVGRNDIVKDGTFDVRLTLIEQRSEPEWI